MSLAEAGELTGPTRLGPPRDLPERQLHNIVGGVWQVARRGVQS